MSERSTIPLVIRMATMADAASLAPRLRPEDALELSLASGPDIAGTLMKSVRISEESWAALEEGQVIALWGVARVHSTGVPWLVCSPEALRYPRRLVSIGKECVRRWSAKCEGLMNFTHPDNSVHHRWLERLGFTFMPGLVPVGDSRTPFRQFYRYSNV